MDLKNIQEQFNSVIEYSQNIPKAETDELFSQWLEAKRDFIELMGGKLIWEFPEKVCFELDEEEKKIRVNDFVDIIDYKYGNSRLSDFVYQNKEGFFKNKVLKDYHISDGTIIPKGMKIIRAFKFFINDKDLLNEVQSIASMIIQEDKIEGILCLSVHPLDFLSASENTHNWRSCHALDGEYRAGNLSYMVDKSTIMCYLKSNQDEILPRFPIKWNSKKWRVWLFFSEDWNMIFAGRQYPFTTESGIDFVKNFVFPKLNLGEWTAWLSNKITDLNEKNVYFKAHSPYVPIKDTLVPMNILVQNAHNSLHFNDLLSSSYYDPVYTFRLNNYNRIKIKPNYNTSPENKYHKFTLGGEVKCLCCGEHSIELSESMMCNNCELEYGECESDIFEICACCGERFIADDGVWIESADEVVCRNCADNETAVCPICGEVSYINNMIYDEKNEQNICKYCYEEEKQWRAEQLEKQKLLRD